MLKNLIVVICIASLCACAASQKDMIIKQVVAPCVGGCKESETVEDCLKDCLKDEAENIIIEEIIDEIDG